MKKVKTYFSVICMLPVLLLTSCIKPDLKLPAQEVIVDMPVVLTDMEIVWNVNVDLKTEWYFGWDTQDQALWGDLDYPHPTSYEVRRYYLGEKPGVRHSESDAFTVFGSSFRRSYMFGYYDMLLWSNIDSEDGTQTVIIDESDLDEVHATTTKTRGMSRANSSTQINDYVTLLDGIPADSINKVVGIFNHPDIFYSSYPQDIYISHDVNDYDYYNEAEGVWVKQINCTLNPLVYIYLVQVIIKNNNGRIIDSSGENAISNISAGTSVNTGRTWNLPAMMYFNTRMKYNIDYQGENVDIIGGKFTTFGLCDNPSYGDSHDPLYSGTRTDLQNNVYLEVVFKGGARKTLMCNVTDQMRKQCHGGVLTIVLDANDLPDSPSQEHDGESSLFVPTIDDYEEVEYDIEM